MKPSKIQSGGNGKPLPQSNEEKDLKAMQRGGAGRLNGGKAKAKKPSAKTARAKRS